MREGGGQDGQTRLPYNNDMEISEIWEPMFEFLATCMWDIRIGFMPFTSAKIDITSPFLASLSDSQQDKVGTGQLHANRPDGSKA